MRAFGYDPPLELLFFYFYFSGLVLMGALDSSQVLLQVLLLVPISSELPVTILHTDL